MEVVIMPNYTILPPKGYDLLVGNEFDDFLVTEVSITTYNTFNIDGHINKSFFTDEEYSSLMEKELSTWKDLKSTCFELIKGKRTPVKFKMVFMKRPVENESVDGLFLNIKYESGELTCITGTSIKTFSLDKTMENSWDSEVENKLKKYC